MTAVVRLKPGGSLDHAEDAQPGGDAVEVAKLALEGSEHGEGGEPGGFVGLLDGEVDPDLAERASDRAIGGLVQCPAR